jgi:hypothetical protein
MQAQTIEAIANICSPGGQSIVGMMREARNQARLNEIGISLDNNVSDTISPVQNKELVANGVVANSSPAKLAQVNCDTGDEINPNPYGSYNPNNNSYYVTNPDFGVSLLDTGNVSVLTQAVTNANVGTGNGFGLGAGQGAGSGFGLDIGNALALGSFAGSEYTNLIPTNLNAIYSSKNLLPSTYTISQAIDDVIRCNCDCWDLI